MNLHGGCHCGRPIPGLSDTDIQRFWSKVEKSDGCWLWRGGLAQRYACFTFKKKTWRAHRISYFLTYGPFEWSKVLAHKCDNPQCVNPGHLFLTDQAGNIRDMFSKGRRNNPARGNRHWAVKLTWGQVCEIRSKYAAGGVYLRQLAEDYASNISTIHHIVTNKWRTVA